MRAYTPPLLWGRNGVFQTFMFSIIGRLSWRMVNWEKRTHIAKDGATIYYDIAHPQKVLRKQGDDITVIIVPGIGNFSDFHYIRYFTQRLQNLGIRCVVVNHLGMVPGKIVTSPRVFTYGGTQDLDEMVDVVVREFPNSKVVIVGYSIGANISMKYAGDYHYKVPPTICGVISICQGYIIRGKRSIRGTELYGLKLATEVVKHCILKNRDILLSDAIKEKYKIDEKKIRAASTVYELDEQYLRKFQPTLPEKEFYENQSSGKVMDKITVPLVMINAKDDPLVPPRLVNQIKPDLLSDNIKDKALILTKHGGHLAYYNRGILIPDSDTWIDNLVLELVHYLVRRKSLSEDIPRRNSSIENI